MKKILVILILGFYFCSPCFGGMLIGSGISGGGCSPTVNDDFSVDTIANYTQDSGSWSISSGVMSSSTAFADSFIRYTTTIGSDDMYASANMGTTGTIANAASDGFGLIVRAGAVYGDSKYIVRYIHDSTSLIWSTYTAGVLTSDVQTQVISALSSDDILTVRVAGTGTSTVMSIWINPTGDCPDEWGSADYTLTDDPPNAVDTGAYAGLFVDRATLAVNFGSFLAGAN